ncbi:DEAD/DEAH box helicase family protein [Alishewanella tabrizica]|uniref:Helicase ATP-binding domain-containing protein n=1 Tax=Alishewanella tabrizica TaxID=671278 RepID=A0ABQ2WIN9_9ALTE|nr:DEAD/DEAH box helicase family protein [Alishewanella tabrizica]GGW57150.1 hypothetical protein GCM10008111_11520 [Alishewanella tabrizica]
MNNSAIRHRQRLEQVLADNTFEHQRQAARKVHEQFAKGSKAVIVAAEMQSGKSGIALALACMQRNTLTDNEICERGKLQDTLFLVTLADVALQEQAAEDLAPCPNVVVSNLVHFKTALTVHFKQQSPKLIIIDECHYGSASDAVRYAQLFDYLDSADSQTRIVLISATPFSAMFAAGGDSILRQGFHTSLVFHKTPADYHGVRQMHRKQQIVQLLEEQRDFTQESIPRRIFINHIKQHSGEGWALIRVASNAAKTAKNELLAQGFSDSQIFIVGNKLNDVEDNELVSLTEFKRQYQNAALFDEKVIAITVASFRAGINFGIEMKEQLIASWDSTISNIAAVVQANIGRASGYHHNTTAKHFSNLDAISAYTELLNYLEQEECTNNFVGIAKLFEQICEKYQIKGFDRGLKLGSTKPSLPTTPEKEEINIGIIQYLIADLSAPIKNDENIDPRVIRAIQLIQDYYQQKPGLAVRIQEEIANRPSWLEIVFADGENFGDSLTGLCHDLGGLLKNTNDYVTQTALKRFMPTVETVVAFALSASNISPNKNIYNRRIIQDDLNEFALKFGVDHHEFCIFLLMGNKETQGTGIDQGVEKSRIKSDSIFKSL